MKVAYLSFDSMNSQVRTELLESYERFLDSSQYILGYETLQFEKEFANYINTQYCIGVSNGLDALFLCLKMFDLKKGDEVIMPANTFIATALAVEYVGAKIVFADPDPDTYLLTSDGINSKLTKQTKLVIPVHLYGQSCEMEGIMNMAERNNLYVIEDNAQAQGAMWNGQYTGSFGHANACSFYPGKNLGALGDAGAVTTDNEEINKRIRILRNYGSEMKYHNTEIGYNKRLDEIQASILRVKLRYLESWNELRKSIAQKYNARLEGIEQIKTPFISSGATSVYHIYGIMANSRDDLQEYLSSRGIQTIIHYPIPPHLQSCFKHLNLKEGDFPIAEELAKKELSLPIYPGLSDDEIDFVCDAIRNFYNRD